jgi:hypothetical protein
MDPIDIRDMDESSEYYVATCTHVDESDEIDACGEKRLAWLRAMHEKGLREGCRPRR